MRFRFCRFVIGVALVASSACASKAPPSLSPPGVKIWQADQAVVALGETQHAAISLNGIQVCEGMAVPAPCRPLLSDANTKTVVDAVTDGITTIHKAPLGWKATALAALDRIDLRLDAAGKSRLKSYIAAARELLVNGL